MDKVIDSVGRLARRFWALLAGVATILGMLGRPEFLDLSDPWHLAASCLVVFSFGFAYGWAEHMAHADAAREASLAMERLRDELSRAEEERRRKDDVRRLLSVLSRRQRAILLEALDKGTVNVDFVVDGEVGLLMEAGLLRSATFASHSFGTTACVGPRFADELRARRNEWELEIPRSVRRRLIRGESA